MAAYAFERYKSKALSAAYGMIVFSALIPAIVTARPLYDYLNKLDLIDTYPGLTLLYTSALIPFTILILRNYLSSIPVSIEEAAEIDGAGHFQKLLFITLPLMKNIFGTCVTLASVAMVSQFDIIYMTTKGGPGSTTLNLPIYLYKAATLENNYGKANAVGAVQIVIGLVLVLFVQYLFREKREKKEVR